MAGTIFSIDIRDDLVCGVVVQLQGGKPLVAGWGAVDPGDGVDAQVLSQLMRQAGFAGGRCRISLGPEHFFFSNLSLPFSDSKKIDRVLPFELEDISPATIDDLVVDAVPARLEGKKTEVIAAMLKRDVLSKVLTAANAAGLDPEIVTVSGSESASRLTRLPGGPTNFVFLDLGLRRATMIVVQNTWIVLIRPLAFDFGRSRAECRFDPGLTRVLPTRPESLEDAFAVLVLAIRQTLRAVSGPMACPPIHLSGPAALLPGLAAFLGDSLGVEIKHFDLLGSLQPDGTPEGWVPGAMNQALALGLRPAKEGSGFNVLKGGFERRPSLKQIGLSGTRIGRAAAVMVLAMVCFLSYDFFSHKVLEKRLAQRIQTVFSATLPGVSRVVDPVGQLQAEVNRLQHSGGLGIGNGNRVLDLLAEISRRIPSSSRVRLTQMVIDKRGVRLRGTTDTFNTVDRIKKELETSPLFQSVTISSANLGQRGEEITFEMKIQLGGS